MTPRSTKLTAGCVWLALVIGCTSGRPTVESTTRTVHKHGSKIVVRYNAQQNKTFFSQDEIKLSPDIKIGSQSVSGKHAFEIDSTAESQGKGSPEKITLTLLHETPTKTEWQYPRPTLFAFVADGQRFELTCDASEKFGQGTGSTNRNCIQSSPLLKDNPSDATYYEALFMDIPLQSFAAIGTAKSVQVQIGTATFNLPSDTILAFRDFAEAMTKK